MKLDSNKIILPTAPVPAGSKVFDPDQFARLTSLFLALFTIIIYLPAGFCDFIDFDDVDYITDNPIVQNGLTWAGFKYAFIGWHASNWHPLTWLSHELDCQLFGLNAGAHHLMNVLFHAANVVLLFRLWLRLTKACWPSALVAAFFAWHPLHVESVAWVSERKDVLSTFFGLLAMLAYVRFAEESKNDGRKIKFWLGLSLLAYGLSLLAKPMLVTLPCVLLLLDYWPLGRLPAGRQLLAGIGRRAGEKWLFFLLAAFCCVMTWLSQKKFAIRTLQEYALHSRIENITVAYASYLGKLLWPVHLCVLYPLSDHYSPGKVWFSALVLVVLSWFVWRWRTRGYLVVGWLWFLGMLVPVIGLVQVGGAAMADRYMYLPSVGLLVAVVFGIAEARVSRKLPFGQWFGSPQCCWAGCVALTEYQLTFWRNSIVLFEHVLKVTKNNAMAHMMLGVGYEKNGQDEEARQEFHKTLSIYATVPVEVEGGERRPLSAQVELLLGQAAEQKGQFAEAITHYREVLRLDPDVVEAHNNLGNLLDDGGQSEAALGEYRSAVRLRPQTPLVHENLGTQLLKMNHFDEAMQEYQEAARLAPEDPQPVYLCGKAWLRQGHSAEAIAAFQEALQLNPNDCPSLVWLARVLATDQSRNCEMDTKPWRWRSRPPIDGRTQPLVIGTLAMACAESGRFDVACKAAQAALDRARDGNPETISNLQAQLLLYEANQPFRESFTNASSR